MSEDYAEKYRGLLEDLQANHVAITRNRVGQVSIYSRAIDAIRELIGASHVPGPKTAEMVAYCKIEYADKGHVWDARAGKIVKDFIDEIEGQGVPR